MPQIVESVVAMLACARYGLVHSVVFAGFASPAIEYRLNDLTPRLIITADIASRRGKTIDILSQVRQANQTTEIPTLVYARQVTALTSPLETDWVTALVGQPTTYTPHISNSEDPLFILYTSGTTGKPKGIVHTTVGYHVYTHFSTRLSFNLSPGDVYWCTADVGWITGHSYVVYGPLSVGATVLISEGVPDYPDASHWWSIVEKHKVQILYTSPTALRLLMKYGTDPMRKHDLSSLKLVGSVGEPLNPEVWQFVDQEIGEGNLTIIDTWWQTETGGHAIVTLPSLTQKPGKAGLPFFGIAVDIIDESGQSCHDDELGRLVITRHWPSAMRDHWQDSARFASSWQGDAYITGDIATRDSDGYIQVLGRYDDVLNISGHRIGSAEIENIVITHSAVAESATIAIPDDIRGEIARIYLILKPGTPRPDHLESEIKRLVHSTLGHHVVIDSVEVVHTLPKTRSGKIMRRFLRAQATDQEIGDTSTLED
jgi:acetyl-CoA synthetase